MTYKTYQIGEFCSLVKGEYPTMKTEPGEYPLVVTAAYRRSSRTYQLEGPAVCVPLISSTGHGHAALHRVHYQEGKFALANLLVALIPKDPELCDTKYLHHLLMAKKDKYFVPLMQGTANVSLKVEDIAGVQIPLPPVDEQRRIVSRLEKLASKFSEARELRKLASAEATALWSSALSAAFRPRGNGSPAEKDAATLLAEQAIAYKDATRTKHNGAHPWEPTINRDGPYRLPKGWVWTDLGSVLTYLVDCINDTPDFAMEETGLLGLKSTNIRPYRLALSERWFMTPEDFGHWNRREKPQPGDIVLTREAPMGNACILPEGVEACLTQRLMLLRCDESFIRRRYILHYLNTTRFKDEIMELCRGLTTPHIRVQDAPRFNVPLAPLSVQDLVIR